MGRKDATDYYVMGISGNAEFMLPEIVNRFRGRALLSGSDSAQALRSFHLPWRSLSTSNCILELVS